MANNLPVPCYQVRVLGTVKPPPKPQLDYSPALNFSFFSLPQTSSANAGEGIKKRMRVSIVWNGRIRAYDVEATSGIDAQEQAAAKLLQALQLSRNAS